MFIMDLVKVLLGLLVCFTHTSSAFWLNWGQQEQPLQPQYFYQQRLLHPYAQPSDQSVPAIPIQVPLQAHMSPAAVQNVQLVPCLCPVSQEYDNYNKIPEGSSPGSFYVAPPPHGGTKKN